MLSLILPPAMLLVGILIGVTINSDPPMTDTYWGPK